MRTAITLAFHKGGEIIEMLRGPDTSIDEQRAEMKRQRAVKDHPVFDRLEYWESGSGCIIKHHYREGIVVVPAKQPVVAEPPKQSAPPVQDQPQESDDSSEFSLKQNAGNAASKSPPKKSK